MLNAVPGVSGRLLSSSFIRDILPTLPGYADIPDNASRAVSAVAARARQTLGPASAIRSIADVAVIPLLHALGFVVDARIDEQRWSLLHLVAAAPPAARHRHGPGPVEAERHVAVVVSRTQSLSSAWRDAVTAGIAADARWVFCSDGAAVRIVDARRTWSRQYLECDVEVLGENRDLQSLLWSLARADSLVATTPLLEAAVIRSARHGVEVCRALGAGVLEALRLVLSGLAPRTHRRYTTDLLFEHSLTVLYRILFLLFAESRGLVPLWHPLYRDRYSLDAIVSTLISGRSQRGLWRALQAISRLAHSGCSAGELSVTAFNGRLFSPAHAEAFDYARVSDPVLGKAILEVGTTGVARSRERARIAYRDLDVEQLGAVYERVLDYELAANGDSVNLIRAGDVRKATGTFYTPRAVTSYLVRRALEPLIAGRSADEILQLRILDPAMGSGAFLVAACRYLAAACEDALVREGRWHAHDVTAADRASLRRQIVSRCLFGADLNPMAVQLARLSLWLATLSANKPLSFLDHHLVTGDSLVGASPADVHRQPPRGHGRRGRHATLPLFDHDDLAMAVGGSVAVRLTLTRPDDSAAVVREKELALADVTAPTSPLGRWARVLDLWCAAWFWGDGSPPDRQTFGELVGHLLESNRQLPQRMTAPMLQHAMEIARRHRFLHWPLTFPEVFNDANGQPLAAGGFDAVVGNPPWDMVRGDSGDQGARRTRRDQASRLTEFVRESGIYRVEPGAHANRYQLFVERALQLARPGGRIGLVLPAGIAIDAGTAPLRRFLFDRVDIDELTGLDNREAVFPIHRSVRFVLFTCTSGRPTSAIRCRFGISRPESLDQPDGAADGVTLTRSFLSRLSGSDDLGIPEVAGAIDLRLLERMSASFPRLGASDGWSARFGRELNASDDRRLFEAYSATGTARPVVEGKQIEPFRVALDRSRYQLCAESRDRVPRQSRLAYRDVASATNRLTLIAAIVPAQAVTTHTLFCLKTVMSLDAQQVLCGLLNSYVANYLVRFRVNTHVTASLVSRLPLPFLTPGDPAFRAVRALVRELLEGSGAAEETDGYAELQAVVARLYGLSAKELDHVLSTFPLVPEPTKEQVRLSFRRLTTMEYDAPRH